MSTKCSFLCHGSWGFHLLLVLSQDQLAQFGTPETTLGPASFSARDRSEGILYILLGFQPLISDDHL